MTPLERAARALFADLNGLTEEIEIEDEWAMATPDARKAFMDDVRTVLLAIREPSEAMQNAAGRERPTYYAYWQAMIDALLAEERQ